MLDSTGPTTIRVRKLLVQETGTYHDMWRRTYKTRTDGNAIAALQERLHGQTQFSPSLVAGVAGQFLTVDATPEKGLAIANGWGQRRFLFMMEVAMVDAFGTSTIETLSGYSDSFDITSNMGSGNHINPNMIFNINSIVTIMETSVITPTGRQIQRQIRDNSHLLVDRNSQGMRSQIHDETMRPEDVFSNMSLSGVSNHIARNSYDARTALSVRPVKSTRANNVASNFVAKTLEAYSGAWITQQVAPNQGENLYSEALGLAAENLATTDPLLRVLQQVRGSPYVTSVFTLNDLERLDPGCTKNPQVFRPMMFKEAERAVQQNRHMDNGMQTWDGATLETQIATIMSQTVPAIMMELLLTGVQFKASNKLTTTRANVVNIEGHYSFSEGINMGPYLASFERKMINEVLRDISRNGDIDYQIWMRVDMLREAEITVQVYQRPPVRFKAPVFCDALFTPVVTSNHQTAVTMASDFEDLQQNILAAAGAPSMNQTFNPHQNFSI